jgi:hypothetical protein
VSHGTTPPRSVFIDGVHVCLSLASLARATYGLCTTARLRRRQPCLLPDTDTVPGMCESSFHVAVCVKIAITRCYYALQAIFLGRSYGAGLHVGVQEYFPVARLPCQGQDRESENIYSLYSKINDTFCIYKVQHYPIKKIHALTFSRYRCINN